MKIFYYQKRACLCIHPKDFLKIRRILLTIYRIKNRNQTIEKMKYLLYATIEYYYRNNLHIFLISYINFLNLKRFAQYEGLNKLIDHLFFQ